MGVKTKARTFVSGGGDGRTADSKQTLGEFKLNGDTARRDELLDEAMPGSYLGADIRYFTGMTPNTLRALIEEGFADGAERQNAAPPIAELIGYMESHQGISAIGYAIAPERDDYRVSVEGLVLAFPYTDEQERSFREFCEGADELFLTNSVAGHGLRAWWD